ncbi:protein CHUP1, chloroplastic-like isoform X2 [Chenopodium quinoa]|uniref:protein CHUP1, chloroplastic-like isoform X2 n=1 Tax=Chenopodium quinoa TaxID=63459 RepID=UPI000B786FA5|nr:protein CHUP1, chloroplastic-like isoform X2 [Chenopodium quinoa]
MMMMIKDRQDIKPILVKFGVALALSFAGFLYSRIRIKRINPSDPPPPPVSDSDKKADSEGRIRVKDYNQPEMDSVNADDKPCIRVRVDNSAIHASPNGRYSADRDAFLLPEFDQVVKEFDAVNSSKTDGESFTVKKDLPKSLRREERDDYEQEIMNLQKRIKFLVERERKLEIQLLEYYGLKEQETVMRELQNRLKINNIETKLFLMKIENLQAENKRLKEQVADYSKVVSELEAARAKIKLLKRKIRSEAEQNREQILDLTQRVVNFQEHEHEHEVSTSISDDQSEVQRLTELEAEAEELRKCNENLQQENADLAQRLESTQILATSFFEDPDKEELHKQMIRLREENEKLINEVERLQVDRCGEVEELVYLRWINACLRYELRNYQPPPGKTVARDLSMCLSPTSEKKAKQLILEYANTEDGANKEPPSLTDFDFDQWPSSQPSYLTDSTDHDESPGPNSVHKPHNKKIKFFSNLRKLVRGISSHHHHHSYNHNQGNQVSPMSRSFSVDDIGMKYYAAGHSGSRSNPQSPRLASSSQNSNNSSMEYQPLTSLAEEEENANRVRSKSLSGVSHVLGRERPGGFLSLDYTPVQESDYWQKSDLTKYAEVFRESRWLQKHKKSASYSTG